MSTEQAATFCKFSLSFRLIVESMSVFGLHIREFCNFHGCGDAESWVVLLHLCSHLHQACQLRLGPSHLGCKVALVCRDYLPDRRRYSRCNKLASRNCHVFFRDQRTSDAFSVGKMMSYTSHIIYQNDPRESRNRSISREISLRTL